MIKPLKDLSFLFVCTGNICRSPTAEAVFRSKIKGLCPDYRGEIDSAGIEGYHIGEPPDARTREIAAQNGVDMKDLRARRVSRADFETYDYIYAMDRGHFRALKAMQREGDRAQVEMYLAAHPLAAGGDVPDPYYGSRQDFIDVFELVDEGADIILKGFFD